MVWIGAHDQQVWRLAFVAVTDTGRNDQDVAGADVQFPPVGAAKQYRCLAPCDAKGLVRVGMEMMVRMDAVAPGGRPMVRREGLLDRARVSRERRPVHQQWQRRVRDRAVVVEQKCL